MAPSIYFICALPHIHRPTHARTQKDSWASYVTETRMAGSPTNINEFMDDICTQAKPGAIKDLERLVGLKRKDLGLAADAECTLESWDRSYVHGRSHIIPPAFSEDPEGESHPTPPSLPSRRVHGTHHHRLFSGAGCKSYLFVR